MKILSFVIILSVALPAVGLAAPETTEPAAVFTALQLLQTHHIDKVDAVSLLVAALEGLRRRLSQLGAAEGLPDLDRASEGSARASFVARFNRAVAMAGGRLTADQLQQAAVSAMAASFGDPYTAFITPEELAVFQRGGFGGIGIIFRRVEGGVYVWRVFSGGPAARAGLRELDQIVAVDDQQVAAWSNDEVANRIRGPEGSTVKLTIRRPRQSEMLTLSINRGFVRAAPVAHRMLQGGIGYIGLSFIDQGAATEMRRALEDLSRQGMRALVIDLRRSGGGPYRELDDLAPLLLPPDLPIYSLTGPASRTYRTAGVPLLAATIRIVVIVSGDTESLPELLAAAFAEHGRGRLVGTRTAGRGGVYQTFDLPGGGAVRIKVGRAFTGKGSPIENGVRPDIEVELRARDLDEGRDPQLERAVQMASQP